MPEQTTVPHERFFVTSPDGPKLAMQVRRAAGSRGDVLYVHGSTFGADLSVLYALDGRSWADALNDAGFTVWGLDFAGYGESERYAVASGHAVGSLAEVLPQLRRAVGAVRQRNGQRRLSLLGHSWGATVAAAYAAAYQDEVDALVLFAPVTVRASAAIAPPPSAASQPSHYPLTLWAQYRRFVEDVPRGQPQVFDEAHFESWGAAFLKTDSDAHLRTPPAVSTPAGPQLDVRAMWSGKALYDPSLIVAPTLLVRGEWDSVCDADDARRLLEELGGAVRVSAIIPGATHLMHLEARRGLLYNEVNKFLQERGG
ncbi:lysophospholipase [Oxalobacteraceae bacterium OTU3CAMAD1]|nr:lysophospholipase [Oxalobacteraceae bacterium OTU3CAMAD1]